MDKDDFKATASERSLDSVQLVASMLLCFPELSKVRFMADLSGVKLFFNLPPDMDSYEVSSKLVNIEESLKLYCELEGIENARPMGAVAENGATLYIDLECLTRGSISLVVELMREYFGEKLLCEAAPEADAELVGMQMDLIDPRIDFLRDNRAEESLVGIREGGKVMVFATEI